MGAVATDARRLLGLGGRLLEVRLGRLASLLGTRRERSCGRRDGGPHLRQHVSTSVDCAASTFGLARSAAS